MARISHRWVKYYDAPSKERDTAAFKKATASLALDMLAEACRGFSPQERQAIAARCAAAIAAIDAGTLPTSREYIQGGSASNGGAWTIRIPLELSALERLRAAMAGKPKPPPQAKWTLRRHVSIDGNVSTWHESPRGLFILEEKKLWAFGRRDTGGSFIPGLHGLTDAGRKLVGASLEEGDGDLWSHRPSWDAKKAQAQIKAAAEAAGLDHWSP